MDKILNEVVETLVVVDVNTSGVLDTNLTCELRDSEHAKKVIGKYLTSVQSGDAYAGKVKVVKSGDLMFALAFVREGTTDQYGTAYVSEEVLRSAIRKINKYANEKGHTVAFSDEFGIDEELNKNKVASIIEEIMTVDFDIYATSVEDTAVVEAPIQPETTTTTTSIYPSTVLVPESKQGVVVETPKVEATQEEQEMNIKVFAVTGHRPKDLSKELYNMKSATSRQHIDFYKGLFKARMEKEELDGVIVLSGMAQGIDTIVANAVLELQSEGLNIHLQAAIPFESQDANWNFGTTRDEYYQILSRCMGVTLVSSMATPNMECHFQKFIASSNVDVTYAQYSTIVNIDDDFGKAMQLRNQYMIDECDELLAFWNGKQNGGTYNCVRAALRDGVKVTGLVEGVDINDAAYKAPDYEAHDYEVTHEPVIETTDVESYVRVDNIPNRVATEVMHDMLEAKNQYFDNVGQLNIIIHDIHLYPKPYEFSYGSNGKGYSWGVIAFQVPKGLLVMKHVENNKTTWVDASDYDVTTHWRKENGTAKYGYSEYEELTPGTGIFRMAIQSFNEDEPFVSFPNRGTSALFKALDVYRKGDEEITKRFSIQAVNNIEAVISASVAMKMETLKVTNLKNNLNKGDCQNMIRLYSRDDSDAGIVDKKSKSVYPQIVVEQLTENGNHRPNVVCTRFERILGTDASRKINNALRFDGQFEGVDSRTNEVRVTRHNEFVIDGKIENRQEYYENDVKKECMGCPFYASCGQMTTSAIQNEIEKKGYSLYLYKENLRASKVSVQCKTNLNTGSESVWDTVYPHEVMASENATFEGLRYVSVGGVVAEFFNEEVLLNNINPFFEPQEEGYDGQKYDAENKIQFLFAIANNVWNEEDARIDQAIEVAMAPFVGTNESQVRRFDRAVELLRQNLERLELDNANNEFPVMFSGTVSGEGLKVEMDQLTEMFELEKEGAIGYGQGLEGLEGKELMGYLNDYAQQYVDSVIYEGVKINIVGGSIEETERVAGAMQAKLQQEVQRTVRQLRKALVKPSEIQSIYSEEFVLYYTVNSGIVEELV